MWCLTKKLIICSSTRQEKILTTDIQVVFRGLKFFFNDVIGQISGFWSALCSKKGFTHAQEN